MGEKDINAEQLGLNEPADSDKAKLEIYWPSDAEREVLDRAAQALPR